ncbi:outer membrane beta-barrel protein [Bradyrhizobium sp. UFLA05-153]
MKFLQGELMKYRLGWALAASLFSVGIIGTASAADMAVKAPPLPVPEVWTWTGFYVGGNLGGAWSDNRLGYDMPFTTPGNIFTFCGSPAGVAAPVLVGANPFDLSTSCSRPSSFIGGAQIGYNWQMGTWVVGIEGDGAWQQLIQHSFVQFGTNRAVGAPMGTVASDTAYFRSEQGALGTVRGRIGYTGGNWLLYATGGLAVGAVKHSMTEVLAPGVACPVAPSATCRTVSDDTTRVGWTVGAGAEWLFARNWSVGAEYLYVDLGRTTLTLAPAGGFFFNTSTARFDDREHVARVKINYHFGGPVVARY